MKVVSQKDEKKQANYLGINPILTVLLVLIYFFLVCLVVADSKKY